MAELVRKQELIQHSPEIRDGLIVGCQGCQWSATFYKLADGCWMQYLRHLPTYHEDGDLALSDGDCSYLEKIDAAFEGPVKDFGAGG